VSDAELGSALLWIGVGALGSIRWAGRASDRFDRSLVALSIAAMALAGVLPVFAHGVVELSLALLVLGLCAGAVDAGINASATRSEAGGRPVVSLAHGVFSVAVVMSSLGVAAGQHRGGPPWALVVVAGFLVLAAVLSTRLSTGHSIPDRSATASRGPWSPRLLIIGILAALAYLVENAWQSWGAIQLHASVGASLAVSALAPAVFATAAAAGRFAGHLLAAAMPAATIFGAGAATAAAGSVVGALAPSTALVLLGIAVAGLGTSVCAPTLIGLAGRTTSDAHGAATGTVITIAYLGFVFGPAAVGLLSGATTLPTALVGVAIVAAGLLVARPVLVRIAAAPAAPPT
jgi:MFS family permease